MNFLQHKCNLKVTGKPSKVFDLNRCFSCPEHNFCNINVEIPGDSQHPSYRDSAINDVEEAGTKLSTGKDTSGFTLNRSKSKLVHFEICESEIEIDNQNRVVKLGQSAPDLNGSFELETREQLCMTKSDTCLHDRSNLDFDGISSATTRDLHGNRLCFSDSDYQDSLDMNKKVLPRESLSQFLERKPSLENISLSAELETCSSISADNNSMSSHPVETGEIDDRFLVAALSNVTPSLTSRDGTFVLEFLSKLRRYGQLLMDELSKDCFSNLVDQLAVAMTDYFIQEERLEQKHAVLLLLRDIILSVDSFRVRFCDTPLSVHLAEELKSCKTEECQDAIVEVLLALTSTDPDVAQSLLTTVDCKFLLKMKSGIKCWFEKQQRQQEDYFCNVFLELLLNLVNYPSVKYSLIEVLLQDKDIEDLITVTVHEMQNTENVFVVTSSKELLKILLKASLAGDMTIAEEQLNMVFDVFTGNILSTGDHGMDDLEESLKILHLLMTSSQFTPQSAHWNRIVDISRAFGLDENLMKAHETQLRALRSILKKQLRSSEVESNTVHMPSNCGTRRYRERSVNYNHDPRTGISISLPELFTTKIKDL